MAVGVQQSAMNHRLPALRLFCWTVMDRSAVLIHVFHPELRRRYALEQLWGDGNK